MNAPNINIIPNLPTHPSQHTQKTVRIRATKLYRYSPNGWDNAILRTGEEATVREEVAKCGVDSGNAVIVGEAEEPTAPDEIEENPEHPKPRTPARRGR